MTDAEDFEGLHSEPGAIGVGMGGSCPVCRAPVDLGQEFCLECGSPIRFTPRQRRPQRGRTEAARGAAPAMAPPQSGFPWIPFLVVLALIGGGVVFALVDSGGDSRRSGSATTEEALPSIDNTQPETTPNAETTTVEDCATAASPLDDTQPAVGGIDDPAAPGDPAGPTADGSEQIPEVTDGSAPAPDDGFQDPSVPSTDGETGEGTVTVDRDGNLCSGDALSPDPSTTAPGTPGTTDPTATTPGTPGAPGGTSPQATASGDWPAGRTGWTVIVAGYAGDQSRATQRAADLREDGFDDGGVLFSTDYTSLCPGFYVVFSGVFDTEAKAEARLKELLAKYPTTAGMNVREITTGGTRPARCATVRPQN